MRMRRDAGEVGNFVLCHTGGFEHLARLLIEIGGGIVVGNKVSMVAGASGDQFAAEAGIVVHFEHVHAGVRNTRGNGLGHGEGPKMCIRDRTYSASMSSTSSDSP